MQIEAPEMWGKSVWRVGKGAHGAFTCTEGQLSTKNGWLFSEISAITATDAWHAEKGFIGSVRQAQAFVG